MEQTFNTDNLSQYRKNLLADLMSTHTLARELLDLSDDRQTCNYNQDHCPLQFEPGDFVRVTALSGIVID